MNQVDPSRNLHRRAVEEALIRYGLETGLIARQALGLPYTRLSGHLFVNNEWLGFSVGPNLTPRFNWTSEPPEQPAPRSLI
ncbi:hypothetical protein F7731_22385 [Cytobacillus depressus]|uniref:Uncharacterized protein n=1 Tax=Cytobacillus depressus TaxID=1602942 RepID=A0A6L3UZ39_9BACI|nr:hypothetical protein F7731_22385 [Cytobacillus depressus]